MNTAPRVWRCLPHTLPWSCLVRSVWVSRNIIVSKTPQPHHGVEQGLGRAKEKGNALYIVINLSTVGDISHSAVRISSFDIISCQYRSVKDVIIRNSHFMRIKTACGIEKYNHLRTKKGALARLRLYWFLVFGSLRDVFK